MVFVCAICSESIEKSPAFVTEGASTPPSPPPRGKSNLSAAPCGHVFHTFCITKWTVSGAATSHQCPNCRKNLTKKFVALFPDSYDEKPGSPDSPGPSSSTKSNINDLELAQLKSKLHTVEADFKIQVNMYELLTQDRQALQTQFNREQRDRLAVMDECEKYKQIAATRDGESRLLEFQVAKLKLDLDAEKKRTEEERREKEKIHSKALYFLQRKQEEIKTHYMDFAAFNLEFDRDTLDSGNRRLEPLPGTSRDSLKSVILKSRPRRGKKMVYEKSIDEILDLEDEEAVLVEADRRKRSKLMSQRSADISGAPKSKLKRFSSELSMSPITLSSDTDDDQDIQAVMDTA